MCLCALKQSQFIIFLCNPFLFDYFFFYFSFLKKKLLRFLVACYVPHAGQKLERLAHRIQWDAKLRTFLEELKKKKSIVWGGGIN